MGHTKLSAELPKRFLCSVAVAVLWAGTTFAVTPDVSPTKFEGIDCDGLISVFKRAYTEAGFRFEKAARQYSSGHVITTIVFRFSLPEHQGKRPAMASFVFDSDVRKDQNPLSCSTYGEGFGGDSESYTSEEWSALMAKMISANLKAAAQIESELGKSLH